MKEQLVINTLVFLEQYQQKANQIEMLEILNKLGYQKIEVRREFFKDEKEIAELGLLAKKYQFEVFYSVPKPLYSDGNLLMEQIRQYFIEARKLGSHFVKMIIGDFINVKTIDRLIIQKLCDEYAINLMVENDQTIENGKIDKILSFLDQINEQGGGFDAGGMAVRFSKANQLVGFTFDTGNWVWTGENAVVNAKKIKDYVWYIHLKDVAIEDELKTTGLGEGIINIWEVLDNLPNNVPLAIEYPIPENLERNLETEYQKINNYKKNRKNN